MKREIKFRAWDVVAKHIIYDPQVTVLTDDLNKQFTIDANEYEWMQYTGLKDKNGKEIYEGDIINYVVYGWGSEKEYESAPVVFIEGSFGTPTDSFNDFDKEDVEVIGNIYENPELLSK